MIGGRELFGVEIARLQEMGERLASLDGGAQLCFAERSHSREEVQPSGVEGSQSRNTDGAEDAFRQQRGAGQGMRAPAGMAHDRESHNAQGVGDGRDVGGCRCHVPAWVRR